VSWGTLVSFEGNRYSVPPAFVDATVIVSHRLGEPMLQIRFDEGRRDRHPPTLGTPGGFGTVYEGVGPDDEPVSVKRLISALGNWRIEKCGLART